MKPGDRKNDERLLHDLTSPDIATPLAVLSYIDLLGNAWFLLAFACGFVMVAAAFGAEQLLGPVSAQAVTGIAFGAACFCMAGGIAVQWYRLRVWLALRREPLTNDRGHLSEIGLPTNRTIPIQLIVAAATALQTWLSHWTVH